MDKEIYTHMSTLMPYIPIVDRGIQLHKMIRLITCALGGEAYLTFMGNEFGHPEWIDFPREGNGESFFHCRRQWGLIRDPLLRYQHLWAFEKAMIQAEIDYRWLSTGGLHIALKNEGDKTISFEKNGLVFFFNFHPSKSFEHYPLPVYAPGKYKIILNSDESRFGGHDRIDPTVDFFTKPEPFNGRPNQFKIYAPSRCALVFHKATD